MLIVESEPSSKCKSIFKLKRLNYRVLSSFLWKLLFLEFPIPTAWGLNTVFWVVRKSLKKWKVLLWKQRWVTPVECFWLFRIWQKILSGSVQTITSRLPNFYWEHDWNLCNFSWKFVNTINAIWSKFLYAVLEKWIFEDFRGPFTITLL